MEEWRPDLIANYLLKCNFEQPEDQYHRPSLRKGGHPKLSRFTGPSTPLSRLHRSHRKSVMWASLPRTPSCPSDFSLINLCQEYPTKIYSSERMDLFYKPDHRFHLPKGLIRLRMYFKNRKSAKDEVTMSIYLKMLMNHLREIEYMGSSASIRTDISHSPYSITVDISGFNDSLSKFLNEYIDQILKFVPLDLQDFNNNKDKKARDYMNFFKGNPYSQALEYHQCALREGGGSEVDLKLTMVDSVTFEDVLEFNSLWKTQVFSELYIAGNFDPESAMSTGRTIENKLSGLSRPLPSTEVGSMRAVNLPEHQIWAV